MSEIITGANKGIGKGLDELFAQKGFDLDLCACTEANGNELKESLEQQYNIKVIVQAVDMSKKEEVKAFAE
eukprot:6259720-Ditylum_brightwellii.AAC.1